ncbi:YedE family putative selenium transporter [Lachnospiraceae bacterium LCP25S3_G4]
MNLSDSKVKLALAGVICGIIAAVLAATGNPANMAICVACFIRDTAGAMKFHAAPVVQYARPEIIGIILGSFFISVGTKEYRSTGGSSPMTRFVLGMVIMIGSLVFLGCPLRMVIRMSAGDLNAYVALIGFVGGVATGVVALKKGFSLGRAHETHKVSGGILPVIAVAILVLATCTTLFVSSTEGPGSMHAPIIVALIGGLLFGVFAQKSRMCFAGSIRDVILMKNFDLISVIGGLFVVMLIFNIATGGFHFGFAGQPIAHTEHIWNILGMYAVGFAAVLAGGCPLRQLVLAGQGSSDSAVTVLGLFVGAAVCHNFGLASSGEGTTPAGRIACIICIVVLFLVAFVGNKKDAS